MFCAPEFDFINRPIFERRLGFCNKNIDTKAPAFKWKTSFTCTTAHFHNDPIDQTFKPLQKATLNSDDSILVYSNNLQSSNFRTQR